MRRDIEDGILDACFYVMLLLGIAVVTTVVVEAVRAVWRVLS